MGINFGLLFNVFNDDTHIKKGIHKWMLFLAFTATLPYLVGMLGGLHISTTSMKAGIMMSISLLFLLKARKLEWIFALFLLYCGLTIMIDNVDPLFQPWSRWALFSGLVAVVSPFFQSNSIRLFRLYAFRILLIFSMLAGVTSFIGYFFGINLFDISYSQDSSSGIFQIDIIDSTSNFSGFLNHSMILGPIAAIGGLYLYYLALARKKKILWLLFCASIGASVLAASRAALGGLAFGITIMSVFYFKNLAKSSGMIIGVVLLLSIIFSLFGNSILNRVISKQETRIEQGGAFDSRTLKVLQRIDEIKQSPFTGIGFNAVDKSSVDYNPKSGVLEPGTSWLAIFSMTGVIGFVLFVIIFIMSINNAWHSKIKERSMLLGMLSMFAFHWLFEGYILAGGSPFCFISWLTMGMCYDSKYYVNEI